MKLEGGSVPQPTQPWRVPEVMATIGPTLEKPEDLCRAIEAGAGWFRLPCGYRERPHLENARAARWAANRVGIPTQLLLDLPSSRPRTGRMEELRALPGDGVVFWDPELTQALSRNGAIPVPLPGLVELLSKLRPGHRMWFCDGRLSFVVETIHATSVLARMEKGTIPLKAFNSLFLPDSQSPFGAITTQDIELFRHLANADVLPDWVALSLISSAADVRAGRKETHRFLWPKVRIMAKFETVAAVESAPEILREADGIMVARGDLGLAVGYVALPEVQERLVVAAREAGRVVVVATQVLETFAETGLPQ